MAINIDAKKNFFLNVLFFLRINSIPIPNENKRHPMSKKSDNDQTTSLLNCIAPNGINNKERRAKGIMGSFFSCDG